MTFKELQAAMMTAMKERNRVKKDVIADMVACAKNMAIEKGCKDNITEALVDEVLLKELKTVKEMIDTCPLDRVETRQEYTARYNIVASYAPEMLTPDKIKLEFLAWGLDNNIELTKANRSVIMKGFMPLMKGRADGKLVNEIITEVLK